MPLATPIASPRAFVVEIGAAGEQLQHRPARFSFRPSALPSSHIARFHTPVSFAIAFGSQLGSFCYGKLFYGRLDCGFFQRSRASFVCACRVLNGDPKYFTENGKVLDSDISGRGTSASKKHGR